MRSETVERLRCPLCHGRFQWSAVERSGTEIRSAQVLCPSCGTRSEVREGIGYFLPGDAELARDSPRGRMGEGRPRPATDPRWARSIHRCAEFARGALGPDAAPLLALDAQGILAPFAPGGGYHVVQDPAELAPRGDPGSDGWDELVVDLHSLPFVDDAAGAGIAGPSLQATPGTRVILRELHRLVRGRLVAIVAVQGGTGTEGGERSNFTEEGLLEEFRGAHWSPQFVPVDEVELARGVAPDGSVTVRWGVVLAE